MMFPIGSSGAACATCSAERHGQGLGIVRHAGIFQEEGLRGGMGGDSSTLVSSRVSRPVSRSTFQRPETAASVRVSRGKIGHHEHLAALEGEECGTGRPPSRSRRPAGRPSADRRGGIAIVRRHRAVPPREGFLPGKRPPRRKAKELWPRGRGSRPQRRRRWQRPRPSRWGKRADRDGPGARRGETEVEAWGDRRPRSRRSGDRIRARRRRCSS